MQLKARTKQHSKTLPPSPPKQNGVYDQIIYIRCNTLLYNTIQNMIRASHAAMDFTFLSPTDFIRSALKACQEHMELTELEEAGEKIATHRTGRPVPEGVLSIVASQPQDQIVGTRHQDLSETAVGHRENDSLGHKTGARDHAASGRRGMNGGWRIRHSTWSVNHGDPSENEHAAEMVDGSVMGNRRGPVVRQAA